MKHARPDYDRIQDPAGLIPDAEPVFLRKSARYADNHGGAALLCPECQWIGAVKTISFGGKLSGVLHCPTCGAETKLLPTRGASGRVLASPPGTVDWE